jgi:hypothetical protein
MQLTSIEELYSKLVRELPLQEELNESYVTEWVREALKKIDNYAQWEQKSLKVTIKEYVTPLPADFYAFDATKSNQSARLQGSYAYFGIRNGTATIHYLAMPLDKKGRPFIPDTEDYKDALMYYITSKLYKKGLLIPDRDNNEKTEYDKWLDKKREARADLHLAQHHKIQKIADDYHSMTPAYKYSPTRRHR